VKKIIALVLLVTALGCEPIKTEHVWVNVERVDDDEDCVLGTNGKVWGHIHDSKLGLVKAGDSVRLKSSGHCWEIEEIRANNSGLK
jgi:hypothetical protein